MKNFKKIDEITLQDMKDYNEIVVVESEDDTNPVGLFEKKTIAEFRDSLIAAPINEGQKIILIQSDSTEEEDIKLLKEKLHERFVTIGYRKEIEKI
ncbi:hypothetical protein BCS42_15865 [Crenothrix sp. D3]|nr:hypothetical protein BCS42_15865 [Crenothrix sp. D3]